MGLTGRLALLALPLGLLSCGAGLSSQAFSLDGGGRPDRGHTGCGGATCEPGTYCDSPTFQTCLEGCQSDENCAVGLECRPETGTCAAPSADEGEPCDGQGRCWGEIYYCYFGSDADASGTCRKPCASSFDCGLGYHCCPLRYLSASACVPSASAPQDGTCQ